jgi:hypothetical protein
VECVSCSDIYTQCIDMSYARLAASFSCSHLASSAPQCLPFKPTPRRAVATKQSRDDVDTPFSTNGTSDSNNRGSTPFYDDFHPDDLARPKRNSSAVNAAVYEVCDLIARMSHEVAALCALPWCDVAI